ncbi:MAG: alginate export family protein [Candidatus Omnitrophica bacterium]|nr:alginate export family protein [Candidatus Omnitrophota bacterium]
MFKKTIIAGFAMFLVCSLNLQKASADIALTGGGAERVRYELWKNIFDMNNDALDNRSFFRFKTSLWGQAAFDKDFDIYAKLTDEFKSYTYYAPSSSKMWGQTKKGYPFDINEVIFDNLYVDVNNVFSAPVNLRLGRQDLTDYGEGFLIFDGTPNDGSRSYYFNAAKANWKVDENNSLDLIYIDDPRSDEWLPIINGEKVNTNLTSSQETAGVLYLKNKAIEKLPLEGYYIYKTEGQEGPGFQSQKGIINTVGSYAKYDLSPFTLRGQFAYQFGTYGDNDRQGLGGYAFIDRDFKDITWTPTTSIGFVYLSGDDSSTSKNESWDPLFSRYPWYSELYNLSYKSETGILAYWTNLQMIRSSAAIKPTEKSKITLFYNYLRANTEIPASTVFSGRGRDRGQLPQLRIDYMFNKNVTAYILGEYFLPGDVYLNNDDAIFIRCEMQIKF